MISFDWEESIFRGIHGLWKRYQSQPVPPGAVTLDQMGDRCLTLAQLVAGRPLHLRTAEKAGGIRGPVLLLPAVVDAAPTPTDNRTLYLLRSVLAGAMIRRNLIPDRPIPGMPGRVHYLFAVQRANHDLFNLFDRYQALHTRALGWELAGRPDPSELSTGSAALEKLRLRFAAGETLDEAVETARFKAWEEPVDLPAGFFLWGESLTASDLKLADQVREQETMTAAGDGTEIKAPPRDHITLTTLEKTEETPPLPIHTFEKTETLDDYSGGARPVDGADELNEHEEALQELDLRQVIRGGRETRGFYKVEIDIEGTIPDVHHVHPGEQGITYPEWFAKSRRYRHDWVTVYPTQVRATRNREAHALLNHNRGRIRHLSDQLLAHRTKHAFCRRQSHGDELDLDAVVNARADRAAGRDPGEKLYISRRKLLRDTAVTLLFDISLSSGSWIDGRRVLDVTRETVLVLGQVADNLGDTLRILAFASNTRNHCRVYEIKDWREPWRQCLGRITAVEPRGYTRIGPALRHAAAGFKRIDAHRQGLLLITDGKPTDYDRYEGNHGRDDIRMAVREARDAGIHTHALALDPKARRTLPTMFGTAGWQVLRRPGDLTDAVVTAYGRFHRT
ncbi:nitric oxide reductase activation protein NorD [Acanthopleuribacter pedis]|uniref:VWA domain-containing protein n=1 Tax=Acanthopleuribacter pedis TaxID=442870 RepID=A0A8J7QFA2_9BACT|nr:VWA domain-containing protein [Acanthopleuribacter pedis]MBO1318770.1 VWA domain-containing protein [Acanthopleuribacter pedis]